MASDADDDPNGSGLIGMLGGLNQFSIMPSAEVLNGRLAMLGIVAAIGAYAVTGQIIPGLF